MKFKSTRKTREREKTTFHRFILSALNLLNFGFGLWFSEGRSIDESPSLILCVSFDSRGGRIEDEKVVVDEVSLPLTCRTREGSGDRSIGVERGCLVGREWVGGDEDVVLAPTVGGFREVGGGTLVDGLEDDDGGTDEIAMVDEGAEAACL